MCPISPYSIPILIPKVYISQTVKSIIKKLLPPLCRMQKEIALSFRHFNLIWHNIPCNVTIVTNLPPDLLVGIESLSTKRISVHFPFSFFFFWHKRKKTQNALIIEELLSCGTTTTLYWNWGTETGTETVIFEDNKERNMEIPVKSHSTCKVMPEFFRGSTFNCLVKRTCIFITYLSQLQS